MKNTKKVFKKRKRDLPITKFQEKFATEDACREYLFQLKWPQGFICPKCRYYEYYLVQRGHLYQCKQCKKQSSITAGTILHRSHLSLVQWFWAIYLIARDKRGCSALSLKNMIQVSYPTARSQVLSFPPRIPHQEPDVSDWSDSHDNRRIDKWAI